MSQQGLAQEMNNPDQDGSLTENNENNIVSSVMAKANWGQRILSPWVQRALSTAPKNADNKRSNNRQTPITLTGGHTSTLLNRLQRITDKSAIWQPDMESMRPEMIDRFTHAIANRFAYNKTQQSQIVQRTVAETDLTLAGATETTASPAKVEPEKSAPSLPYSLDEVSQALTRLRGGGSASTSTPTSTPSPSPSPSPASPIQRQPDQSGQSRGRLPTLAEVRAALERPHFTKAASSSDQASPPPIQRAVEEQQRPAKPTHIPPRRRLMSRIEEVTPDRLSALPTLSEPPLSPTTTHSIQLQPDDEPSLPPAPKKIADSESPPVTAAPKIEKGPPPSPIQRQPVPGQSPSKRPAASEPQKSTSIPTPPPRRSRPPQPTSQSQPEVPAKPALSPLQPLTPADTLSPPTTPDQPITKAESEPVTVQRQPNWPKSPSAPIEIEDESLEQPPVIDDSLLTVDEGDEIPADTPVTERSSPVQHQPETAMPLPPTPPTPGLKPQAVKSSEVSPPSSGTETAAPSNLSSPSQQTASAGESTKPALSVQRQREAATVEKEPELGTSSAKDTPVIETAPPVQRQTDEAEVSELDAAAGMTEMGMDTSAVGAEDEPVSPPPATRPVETDDEVSGPPEILQRQAAHDLPLRKQGLPNQPPIATPDSQPSLDAETGIATQDWPTTPVQRQREEASGAKPSSSVASEPDFGLSWVDDTPVARSVPPVQPHLDEVETDVELTAGLLEEAVTDVAAVERSELEDGPVTAPVETADDAGEPEETIQRQVEDDLPLRKRATSPQPMPKATPSRQPIAGTEGGVIRSEPPAAPVQRQREEASGAKPSSSVESEPDFGISWVDDTPVARSVPPVQPHLDEVETDVELTAGLEERVTDAAAMERSELEDGPAAETPATTLEVDSDIEGLQEAIQRQGEADLPLRKRNIPHQPKSKATPAGQPAAPVQRQREESSLAKPSPTTTGEPDIGEESALSGTDGDTIDLNRDILIKAEAGSRLPLTKLPAAARQNVAQTKRTERVGVLPQVRGNRPAESVRAGREATGQPLRPLSTAEPTQSPAPSTSQRSELPLARPARIEIVESSAPAKAVTSSRPPVSTVQRQVVETVSSSPAITTSTGADTVQREPEGGTTATPPSTSSSPAPGVDLDKLARQVYPEIKRLLARERDRLSR